mmetsp:Transcript_4468/g.14518  ORF Transcript_4468/g.14518 Transcript_4468/m.14518 type:complete len:246 (-) Transcript_4468:4682-5419(-)
MVPPCDERPSVIVHLPEPHLPSRAVSGPSEVARRVEEGDLERRWLCNAPHARRVGLVASRHRDASDSGVPRVALPGRRRGRGPDGHRLSPRGVTPDEGEPRREHRRRPLRVHGHGRGAVVAHNEYVPHGCVPGVGYTNACVNNVVLKPPNKKFDICRAYPGGAMGLQMESSSFPWRVQMRLKPTDCACEGRRLLPAPHGGRAAGAGGSAAPAGSRPAPPAPPVRATAVLTAFPILRVSLRNISRF